MNPDAISANDKTKIYPRRQFKDEDEASNSENAGQFEFNYFKNLYHFYKTPLVKFFYYYVREQVFGLSFSFFFLQFLFKQFGFLFSI